ncbi:Forkhead transcription factor [Vanrija albida]|uniref:Forkhead transcription factor n=1 Tax=Vanrija albida TaxID=181172 RepID=A0ABR3PSD4_9TREE
MVDIRTTSRKGAADPRTPGTDAGVATALTSSYRSSQSSTRQPSPRKGAASRVLPSPQSLSPRKHSSLSPQDHPQPRLPPSFEPIPASALAPAIPSRYGGVYTPHSPYRPGEYQRSECAPSERTRIVRKLFDDDEALAPTVKEELNGSSPLAPAFEAKMVLRNGASVDLISWLRTNFHHQPPPHTPVTSFMSLVHVQRLLQERFPRVPDLAELHRAVLAAFPHSEWESDNVNAQEPPMMRGLTWHGRDVAEEDDPDATPGRSRGSAPARERGRAPQRIETDVFGSASYSGGQSATNGAGTSRSPTNSSLMSPVSSSTRRALPDTPARSVLDDFAEIVTGTGSRTPLGKPRPLDVEPFPLGHANGAQPSHPYQHAGNRKRHASQSPDRGQRRRASTPDALQELLNAAEAVEGSPLNSVLSKQERGHKRRRTIAGSTTHDFMYNRPGPIGIDQRRSQSVRGTVSPQIGGLSILSARESMQRSPPSGDEEPVSPLVSEESAASQLAALGNGSWPIRRGPASSTASQLSVISESVPLAGPSVGPSQPKTTGRKVNELPTSSQGQFPGVDCKPPYPYHEMIRHAIDAAPDRKLQLAQIYSSIADRFPFFKTLDEKKTAGWQNSIRHNLSLKKMFVRVNKADGQPDDSGGKGGWWTVQAGVPDEGRPGRKAKAKRLKDGPPTVDDVSNVTSTASTPAPPTQPPPLYSQAHLIAESQ